MFRSFFFCAVSLVLAGSLFAAVPNSFSDGQVISAAKINENFTSASTKVVLKVDGATFGGPVYLGESKATVYSKNLYYVVLDKAPTSPTVATTGDTLYYTDAACATTPSYVGTGSLGKVFKVTVSGTDRLYYVSKSAVSSMPALYYNMASCISSSSNSVYPLVANDETVTGFPNLLGSTLSIVIE